MKPRKLPKEKLQRLILVGLLTLIALAGLYFGLISPQHDKLAGLAQQKANAAKKLEQMITAGKQADQIKLELEEATKTLAEAESDVASGDLYAWIINALRRFKAPYKVEIPQYSTLTTPTDVNLLPGFPYKQAVLTIAGTAHFHDLGLFLADLENRFPHFRLCNLTLDVSPPSPTASSELLSFKVEIVTLVKANPS